MNLKDKKLVKALYKFLFYFEQGRILPARLYQWIPDITNIMVWMVVVLKINLPQSVAIGGMIGMFFGLAIFGYWLKHSGMYDTDKYVQANKDPVQAELLKAARIIKERWGKQK